MASLGGFNGKNPPVSLVQFFGRFNSWKQFCFRGKAGEVKGHGLHFLSFGVRLPVANTSKSEAIKAA